MILRALHQLYDRFKADPDYDVAPLGRSYQKVSFVVVIDRNGGLVDIQDARQPYNNRLVPRRVLVPGTDKVSGSGLNPCFLWDNAGDLLGWDPQHPHRAVRCFEAFRSRHLELEPEICADEYSAVCRFLEGWDPSMASRFPILEEVQSGKGVFQIRGEIGFVHQTPGIEQWWDSTFNATDPGPEGQCLITGEFAPIARLHPKIKGVVEAEKSGATIAGFNDRAYWSFGLKQSFNSPVSEEAAHRYTTALNTLLDGPRREKHRLAVAGTTIAFWTEKPTGFEDIFLAFVAEGSSTTTLSAAQDQGARARLEAFLRALRHGREAYSDLDDENQQTTYFILGLSAPTPARVAVRFFHSGTLGELVVNLRRHHRDLEIQRQHGDEAKRPEPEFPPVWMLVRETALSADAIPSVLPGKLIEAVVTGRRYPEGLYAAILRRVAADRSINYARACVIKGYLVRNLGKEVSVTLDPARSDPAYRLGRLFAALEKTQQDALQGIGATIRDRFYASASATPRMAVPRLLRTYQHHLAKLEGGHKVNRERLVQEILAPISDIPAHLGLADQGLFALGYYHQMNAFYTKKESQPSGPEAKEIERSDS